jgi:hypothetical protein
VCDHGYCSGRNGQRLAGLGGVVDFVWRLIVVRLVNPPLVVEIEIARQASLQVAPVLVSPEINILVFDAAPFCGAPQNGAYVPRVITWPTAPKAVDFLSMIEG